MSTPRSKASSRTQCSSKRIKLANKVFYDSYEFVPLLDIVPPPSIYAMFPPAILGKVNAIASTILSIY